MNNAINSLMKLAIFCICFGLVSCVPHQHFSLLTNHPASLYSLQNNINPKVLRLALKAQKNAKKRGVTNSNVIAIVDYSLPSTEKRLWIIDTKHNTIIKHSHVAHGSGSGENYAKKFSNKPGSYQTSLGLFVTGNVYQGKHGKSLTMHGLEPGINCKAHMRRIVIHAADYVNPQYAQRNGRLGRSWGCPAVGKDVSKEVINSLQDKALVFAYYPDKEWLENSSYL